MNTEKKVKLIFVLIGIICLILGVSFHEFWYLVGILFIYSACSDNKDNKGVKAKNNPKTTPAAAVSEVTDCKKLIFRVAGVTYKNEDGTDRQKILRPFKWGDENIDEVTLEHYLYDGRDAFYVKINDKIVGNVPKEYTEKVNTIYYQIIDTTAEVYGGDKSNDGTHKNYGCEVTIEYF